LQIIGSLSKIEKLIIKLKNQPKDFSWDELVVLLNFFEYTEVKKGKTSGSRRKFVNKELQIISLHKPHPGNIMKSYVIKLVIKQLKEKL